MKRVNNVLRLLLAIILVSLTTVGFGQRETNPVWEAAIRSNTMKVISCDHDHKMSDQEYAEFKKIYDEDMRKSIPNPNRDTIRAIVLENLHYAPVTAGEQVELVVEEEISYRLGTSANVENSSYTPECYPYLDIVAYLDYHPDIPTGSTAGNLFAFANPNPNQAPNPQNEDIRAKMTELSSQGKPVNLLIHFVSSIDLPGAAGLAPYQCGLGPDFVYQVLIRSVIRDGNTFSANQLSQRSSILSHEIGHAIMEGNHEAGDNGLPAGATIACSDNRAELTINNDNSLRSASQMVTASSSTSRNLYLKENGSVWSPSTRLHNEFRLEHINKLSDANCPNSVVDNDGDGFFNDVDCDDTNPNINPDATEVAYDGIDNDCDPSTRDDDIDNDGFGIAIDCDDNNPNINHDATEITYNGIDDDCDPNTKDDDLDNDGFGIDNDCNENNPNINPGVAEVAYDGIDNDCDPATLDDDLDQDGFDLANDCDDTNPSINPNATDIPDNGIDENCDGVDATDIVDNDGDGFNNLVDCDDNNPNINPDATEVAYNGIDDDCDPTTLDDDLDEDGFGFTEDCDDNNPNINPDATEVAYNGIDDDCDASTLDDDLDEDGFGFTEDCDDNNPNINPDAPEIAYDGIDNDCDPATLDDDLDEDGFGFTEDCDDNNPNINPDVTEVAYNGLDDDCDPATLDDDLDEDGFGFTEDCDDNNPNINPDATEVVYNGIDDDCDPATLDDDLDEDGFGFTEDCDDMNDGIFPGAMEIVNNGIDEDCDGVDSMTVSTVQTLLEQSIELYPNPTSAITTIQLPINEYSLQSVSLHSINGKRLEVTTTSSTSFSIDLSEYPQGIYLLVFNFDTITVSKKIMKQ